MPVAERQTGGNRSRRGGWRRKLVLIRRDNTEHLLDDWSATDIVVEANIVRGQNARDTASSRTSPAETLPRAVPTVEEQPWPSQQEPAQRPICAATRPTPLEDAAAWSLQPEQSPPVAPAASPAHPKRSRASDTLAGLAAELNVRRPNAAPALPPAAPRPAPAAEALRAARPALAPAASASADQILPTGVPPRSRIETPGGDRRPAPSDVGAALGTCGRSRPCTTQGARGRTGCPRPGRRESAEPARLLPRTIRQTTFSTASRKRWPLAWPSGGEIFLTQPSLWSCLIVL